MAKGIESERGNESGGRKPLTCPCPVVPVTQLFAWDDEYEGE